MQLGGKREPAAPREAAGDEQTSKNGILHSEVISEECSDVMSLMAAVQAGRGVAVVGDFIIPLIGDRVRFVPFVSGAHALEVGLLHRRSGLGENIEKFIAAASAGTQAK